MKRVLITGAAGQDGLLLSDALKDRGCEVYGLDVEWKPYRNGYRIDADVGDFITVNEVMKDVMPDEVYHLAAITRPRLGYESPFEMMRVNVSGTLNVLEAVRHTCQKTRILYVSSDSIFADEARYYQPPYAWNEEQNEHTPMSPSDLYGVTKATGLMLARVYRRYGMSIGCLIPFNHACGLQGDGFLLGHVAKEVVRVCRELEKGEKPLPVEMLSRYDVRDFLHAQDVVDAMILVMEKGGYADYVVGSAEPRTIEEIVHVAFRVAVRMVTNIDADVSRVANDMVNYAKERSDLMRPRADARRLRALGWSAKIGFEELMEEMIKNAISC